jgi:uncharacterized membrane protein YhaH (DUF805 family)
MWRAFPFLALGLVLGSKVRSERSTVVWSMLFGLLYGAVKVLVTATTQNHISSARALMLLGLGLVLAAPIYATAELWRRALVCIKKWIQSLMQR